MSIELSVFTGGLVFAVPPRFDATIISPNLKHELAQRGHPVMSLTKVDDTGVQVLCEGLILWFKLEGHGTDVQKIRVTGKPMRAPDTPERPVNASAKSILAVVLAVLARDLRADFVTWLGKDAHVPATQFIEVALPVTPRRVQKSTLADQDDRERPLPGQGLPHRYDQVTFSDFDNWNFDRELSRKITQEQEDDAEAANTDAGIDQTSLPLRISAWVMTVLVAVFSVPLAWVMFALNLTRGGDFRVTANMLAAIAGGSLLYSTGTAQAFVAMIFN